MTKAELIERVYGRKQVPRDLTKKTVAQIVDAVFTEMGDYFIRTKVTRNQAAKLTYPGFGTFSKRRRGPRVVKHPKTGGAHHDPAAGDRDVLAWSGAARAPEPERQGPRQGWRLEREARSRPGRSKRRVWLGPVRRGSGPLPQKPPHK